MIADRLGELVIKSTALAVLAEAIQPKKSRTFRSGKTGGWKEYFTEEHKKLFKDVARQNNIILILPMYEVDQTGVYYNTAAVIDHDGKYLGK